MLPVGDEVYTKLSWSMVVFVEFLRESIQSTLTRESRRRKEVFHRFEYGDRAFCCVLTIGCEPEKLARATCHRCGGRSIEDLVCALKPDVEMKELRKAKDYLSSHRRGPCSPSVPFSKKDPAFQTVMEDFLRWVVKAIIKCEEDRKRSPCTCQTSAKRRRSRSAPP